MTLPVSGAISFNAINVELTVAGTTTANINQASYRTLAAVPSGTISLSNFYGKSNWLPGQTWVKRDQIGTTAWTTTKYVNALVWNGSIWVAGGNLGACATSSDGITWTFQSGLATAFGSSSFTVGKGFWDGSKFILSLPYQSKFATSTDGVTWAIQAPSISGFYATGQIAKSSSRYVIGGTNGYIMTSTDGTTWTSSTALRSTGWGTTAEVSKIIWDGTKFVAVGDRGRNATSTDGLTWTYQSQLSTTSWGTSDFNAPQMAWNGSVFVIASASRNAYSTDGITWTANAAIAATSFGSAYPTASVATADNFVVVGANAKVATSPDGVTWTYQNGLVTAITSSQSLSCLAYKSGLILGGGYGFTVTSSP